METLFAPLFRGPLKHLWRLARDREYRTFCGLCSRYGRSPRFVSRHIRVHGWDLEVPDAASFLSAWYAIFVQRIYDFHAGCRSPSILDCGANIGLAVLRLKQLYPEARVTAFEADPSIFGALERNVHGNGFRDVELVNKAVWSSQTTVRFAPEGGDSGRIDSGREGAIEVPAVRLRDYLAERIDFLKVDIEGAEVEVLRDCVDCLPRVRAAFVEHHSILGRPQELGTLIHWFEAQGFRSHVHSAFCSPSPLAELRAHDELHMDLQVNLFFFRPSDRAASLCSCE